MKSFTIHLASILAIGAVAFVSLLIPFIVSAQGGDWTPYYEPMVEIPGVTDITAQNGGAVLSQYVNALYGLAIVIAGMIAVIKLVLAGAKYMMSDSFTSKGAAIEDIKGALLGILIILTAFLILATINPRLTGIDFLPENQVAVDASAGLDYWTNFGNSCQNDPSCEVIECSDFLDSSCQASCEALNGVYYDPNDILDAAGLDENLCYVVQSLIPQGEPMPDDPGWYYCPAVTYNSTSFAVGGRQACELWCTATGGQPYFSFITGGGFQGRYANQCYQGGGSPTPPPDPTVQVPVP